MTVGQLWVDKTPEQILADIKVAASDFHRVADELEEDTLVMPQKMYQYLYYHDKPLLRQLHLAGWRSGFTVNGFEP